MPHRVSIADTDVIDRVANHHTGADGPAVWRRATLLGFTAMLFLTASGAALWWLYDANQPSVDKRDPGQGQWGAVLLFFMVSSVLFALALFRDYANRRAQATERLVRNLLFYKHDETRADMKTLLADTVKRIEADLAQVVADMKRHGDRQMRQGEALTDEMLTALARERATLLAHLDVNRREFLDAMVMLERTVPELLTQERWKGVAQRMRQEAEEQVAEGRVAVRYPAQRGLQLVPPSS